MLSFSSVSMTLIFLGYSRNTSSATETDNFNFINNTSSPVSSPVISNIPMRATLSHSLWEQENADEYYMQAPVASSLGENFWGP